MFHRMRCCMHQLLTIHRIVTLECVIWQGPAFTIESTVCKRDIVTLAPVSRTDVVKAVKGFDT